MGMIHCFIQHERDIKNIKKKKNCSYRNTILLLSHITEEFSIVYVNINILFYKYSTEQHSRSFN